MAVQESPALTDAIEFREVDGDRWGDLARPFESRGGPKYCRCMVWRAMPPGASRADRDAKKEALRRRVQEGAPRRHTGLY